MRRLLIATTVVAGLLAAPGAALACSGPMPTFDQLVAQSELIVEGRVSAVLVNGLAYEIEVIEVFKGQATGGQVRIGPTTDPGWRAAGCQTGLEPDSHVIVTVVDVDEMLISLGTAVWYVAPDGSLSSPGGWWTMVAAAANAPELRDMLRDAVPDTALPPPEVRGFNAQSEWALLAAGAGLAGLQMLRRRPDRVSR